KTRTVVFDFEPAARVLELRQRLRDLFKRNTQLRRERDHSQRIVNVMLSGHIQDSFAEILSPVIDPEHRSDARQPDIYRAIIGLVRETVRNSAWQRSTYPGGIFVVEVIKNCAGSLSNQLRENIFNRVEISIKIQVLFLDI